MIQQAGNPRVVVIGSGGHASVVLDILELEGQRQIVGLIDDFAGLRRVKHGYPILGRMKQTARLTAKYTLSEVIIAVGDNWIRWTLARELATVAPQLSYISAVHPAAVIARSAVVGAGTTVMAGAIINPGSRIEAGAIVNTRASVDHDCYVGAFASVAPGATLSGGVYVGHQSAIGPSACVLEGVRIGENSVVGAGAVVTRDVPPEVVVYGNPARVIRGRRRDDPYIRSVRR